MIQQLSFDISGDSEPTDYLFIGIFPELPIPLTLASRAQTLRSKHDLTGKPLAPERFHISLFGLGHSCGLNAGRVRAAIEAAATVKASAFDVTFDSVMSFGQRDRELPLVLRAGPDASRLIEFHRILYDALVKTGLPVSDRFTPHITLLYDWKSVPQEPVNPLRLRVNRFTLVHSLQGKTKHVKLAQWTLPTELRGPVRRDEMNAGV